MSAPVPEVDPGVGEGVSRKVQRHRDTFWWWDRWVVFCWTNPVFWVSAVVGVMTGVVANMLLSLLDFCSN